MMPGQTHTPCRAGDRNPAPSVTSELISYPFAGMLVKPHAQFPRDSDLPDSDDTPANNENQNFLPNYPLFLLGEVWKECQDWYFGVDFLTDLNLLFFE